MERTTILLDKDTHRRLRELAKPLKLASYLRELSLGKATTYEQLSDENDVLYDMQLKTQEQLDYLSMIVSLSLKCLIKGESIDMVAITKEAKNRLARMKACGGDIYEAFADN